MSWRSGGKLVTSRYSTCSRGGPRSPSTPSSKTATATSSPNASATSGCSSPDEAVGDGRRAPRVQERLVRRPELRGVDAGGREQRLDHALGLEEPGPVACEHARHARRLVGQLLGAAQEHVADLEQRNAAASPIARLRARRVQEPREDERPHRRPLGAHRVLELDEVAAAGRPDASRRRSGTPMSHSVSVAASERPAPRSTSTTMPAQPLVVAQPAAAGMAAGHRGRHALDARRSA